MSNRIAVVGDIHLKSVEKFGKYDVKDNINSRTLDKLNIVSQVIKISIEKGVKTVIFLGDIFESINPSERLRSMFFDKLTPLFKADISVHIIVGNHESNLRDLNSFLTVKVLGLDKLCIHDEIIMCDDYVIAPYGFEGALLDFIIQEKPKYNILFSHIEMSPYYKDGISSDEVKSAFKVIKNGHYHIPDELHVGSLCICNRGEFETQHSFEILDKDTLESEKIFIEERSMYKYDMTLAEFESSFEDIDVLMSEHAVLSIKFIDTTENLEKINISNVKNLFKRIHKVVVEKEKIASNDAKTLQLIKDWENKSLTDHIKVYAESVNRSDMIDLGNNIIEESMK